MSQNFETCDDASASFSVDSNNIRTITVSRGEKCGATKFKIQRVQEERPICKELSIPQANETCEFVFAPNGSVPVRDAKISLAEGVQAQAFEVRMMKNDVILKRMPVSAP